MGKSPLEFLASQLGNVVLYDSIGNPSIFVPIPQIKSSELDSSLPDHVHPAFKVNGQTLPRILIGKYKACELTANGTLFSLPNMPPRHTLGADQFLSRMRAFGNGVSGKTVAESGLLLLLAKKYGWNPKGNNYWGCDYRDGTAWEPAKSVTVDMIRTFRGWKYKCLIAHTTSAELLPITSPLYWQRMEHIGGTPADRSQFVADSRYQGYHTINGSGPMSWMLDGTPNGIADLVGNCAEQDYGYRLVNCEIQILEDNNAADPAADLSATSTNWKAILPNLSNDGYTLVAPGTPGTLHWTWQNNKITLDTVEPTFDNEQRNTSFSNLAVNAANVPFVPHVLKELGLFPISGDTTPGTVYVHFTADERFPRRGGSYSSTSSAGLAYVNSHNARAYTYTNYGARPACVELPA
ncbi:MAG: hypothetical protein GXY67_07845 [Clostridiales bacterium]|nr:hypothetical protein [Clostridiales bacterium]